MVWDIVSGSSRPPINLARFTDVLKSARQICKIFEINDCEGYKQGIGMFLKAQLVEISDDEIDPDAIDFGVKRITKRYVALHTLGALDVNLLIDAMNLQEHIESGQLQEGPKEGEMRFRAEEAIEAIYAGVDALKELNHEEQDDRDEFRRALCFLEGGPNEKTRMLDELDGKDLLLDIAPFAFCSDHPCHSLRSNPRILRKASVASLG